MSQPRVTWVSFAPLERTERGLTSRMASSRYRITIPAAALKQLGRESSVTYLSGQANRKSLMARFEKTDAVILGKLTSADRDWAADAEFVLGVVQDLRGRGVRIIADFCDDHFIDEVRGGYSTTLANVADAVVASTPELATVLRSVTRAPVTMVTDPVEGKRGAPRVPAADAASVHLIWYGHWTNLATLELGLPQLEPVLRRVRVRLDIYSNPESGGEELAAQTQDAWRPSGGECRFIEWSAERAWQALAACDAVLIPTDRHNPKRAVKSPNRFTEAVWAGRFVIAHPLAAYEPLADYGWVGEDLGSGLQWLLDNGAAALGRIAAGQEAIERRFAPAVIAREWMQIIDSVVKEPSP